MTTVWTIATNKGGIGKTTLTVNLGSALAAAGQRVLLLDLDKQGHSGLHLGLPREHIERGASIIAAVEKQPLAELAQSTAIPNLEIVPMHPDMVPLEPQLGNLRLYWLHRAIQGLPHDRYDHVLLDTPPTGNLLTAALIAAQRLLVPIIPEPLALEGLGDILATTQDVRETLDAGPQRIYLVVNRWRAQTRLARSIQGMLGDLNLPATTLTTRISVDITLPEASGAQQPVARYRPNSKAAREFAELAREILAAESQS